MENKDLIEKSTSILDKIMNFFKRGMNKQTITDKETPIHAGEMGGGAEIYQDKGIINTRATDGELDVCKNPIISTVDGLRALATVYDDIIYQSTDYGGGIWYYDPADTTTSDNTATVLVVTDGKRLKRINDGVLQAVWFGVKADGITDDYASFQAAVDYIGTIGQGTLILPMGTIYLGKLGGGGIKLPYNSNGIEIVGQGESTVIKLSRFVTRAFDMAGYANNTTTVTYQNITLRKFNINASNIDSDAISPAKQAQSAVTAPSTGYINVDVGDNTGFSPATSVFFPSSNSGNTAGKAAYSIKLLTGSSSIIQVQLNSGDTIALGDTIKAYSEEHKLLGTTYFGNNHATNINFNNINVSDIHIYNIPIPETADSFSGPTSFTHSVIDITSNTAFSQNGTGYNGVLSATNITIERVRAEGGIIGFQIAGRNSSPKFFIDNIIYRDLYHDTLKVPVTNQISLNFLVGGSGYGNKLLIDNCQGYNSSDVGVENDSMNDVTIINTRIKDCPYGFLNVNYNIPSPTPIRNFTTLTNPISNADTTISIAELPIGTPNCGFLIIDNELFYYTYTGTNTIKVTRGLNQTIAVSHLVTSTVIFIDITRQKTRYINCVYEDSNLFTNDFAVGFLSRRNSSTSYTPLCPVLIENCKFIKSSANFNQVVNFEGIQDVAIEGFEVQISNILRNVSSAVVKGLFVFSNKDWDVSNGLSSLLPKNNVTIKNTQISISGSMMLLATAQLHCFKFEAGNWNILFEGINFKSSVLASDTQLNFLFSVTTGAYLSGKILNTKIAFINCTIPIGINVQNGTVIQSLYFNGLDFTDFVFTGTVNNSNYRPWLINVTSDNSIFGDNIKHSSSALVPAARKKTKRAIVTASTYNQTLNEDYIGVTFNGATNIQLASSDAGGNNSRTNWGHQVMIVDEAFAAGTNNITITPYGAERINNVAGPITLKSNGAVCILISIPSGWIAWEKSF